MQDFVVPISNKDTVSLLLILTGKLAAYLLSLSFTFIILYSCDSRLESEAESKMQSELSMSVFTGLLSGSVVTCWGVQVLEVISFTCCCE